MFPGHRLPPSNLSHVPSPQDSTSNISHDPRPRFPDQTQSVARPQGYRIKHLLSIPRPQGYHHQTSVMFPGHRGPQSNLSHVARPQCSTIKPQSYSQETRFPESNLIMFLGHRVSRIKERSCSQARGFHNQTQSCSHATGFYHQTSILLPGHRVPQSNLNHVARPQVSTIKPQSCSQA